MSSGQQTPDHQKVSAGALRDAFVDFMTSKQSVKTSAATDPVPLLPRMQVMGGMGPPPVPVPTAATAAEGQSQAPMDEDWVDVEEIETDLRDRIQVGVIMILNEIELTISAIKGMRLYIYQHCLPFDIM